MEPVVAARVGEVVKVALLGAEEWTEALADHRAGRAAI